MKNIVLLTILCLGSLLFGSCVSTQIYSLKDPAYSGHRFHKVLIFGDFAKIEFQKGFEDEITDDLISRHVAARSSYQLLPPLRRYSDSEKVAIFKLNQFDCYMIVSTTGTNTQEYHVPTYTNMNAAVAGNSNSAQGYSNSVTTGGYAVNQVSGYDFQCELYDLANGKLVCRAQATTNLQYNVYGKTWASIDDVVSSACSNIADELLRNDLFWGDR